MHTKDDNIIVNLVCVNRRCAILPLYLE